MTHRTRSLLAWTPAILVGLFLIVASAVPKIFMSGEGSPLQPFIASLGLSEIIFSVGLLELLCVALFLVPRTSTVGFILIIGFLGGAMATGLTHPEAKDVWPAFPLVLIALLMLSAYFRTPELLDRVASRPVPVVPRWRKVLGWVAGSLIFVLSLISVAGKLMPVEAGSQMDAMIRSIGASAIWVPLGFLQLSIALLFIIPRTSAVGFVLMIGYWGGALATNLSHGVQTAPELLPVLIGFALLTVSAWGRNPELLTRLLGCEAAKA